MQYTNLRTGSVDAAEKLGLLIDILTFRRYIVHTHSPKRTKKKGELMPQLISKGVFLTDQAHTAGIRNIDRSHFFLSRKATCIKRQR